MRLPNNTAGKKYSTHNVGIASDRIQTDNFNTISTLIEH